MEYSEEKYKESYYTSIVENSSEDSIDENNIMNFGKNHKEHNYNKNKSTSKKRTRNETIEKSDANMSIESKNKNLMIQSNLEPKSMIYDNKGLKKLKNKKSLAISKNVSSSESCSNSEESVHSLYNKKEKCLSNSFEDSNSITKLYSSCDEKCIQIFEKMIKNKIEDEGIRSNLNKKILEINGLFQNEILQFYKDNKKNLKEKKFCKFLAKYESKIIRLLQKKIAKLFFFRSKIDLKSFNFVNFSFQNKKDKSTEKNWTLSEIEPQIYLQNKKNFEFNFGDESRSLKIILEQIMGNIKRKESLISIKEHLKKLNCTKNDSKYHFISEYFLICLFLSICDSSVRLKINENISNFMAVPLVFPDIRFCLANEWSLDSDKKDFSFFDINFEIIDSIINSVSLLNVSLGEASKEVFNSEERINKWFHTKFDTCPNMLFKKGAVDVNFDHNSDDPRKISFLTVYGKTNNFKIIDSLRRLVNLILVQVNLADIEKNSIFELLKNLIEFKDKSLKIVIVVTFLKLNQNPKMEKKLKKIQEKNLDFIKIIFFKKIRNHNFDDREYNDTEKEIIKYVYQSLNEFILSDNLKMNKESFLKTFLKKNRIKNVINNEFEKKDKISNFLKNIKTKREKEKNNLIESIKSVNKFASKIKKINNEKNLDKELYFTKFFIERRLYSEKIQKLLEYPTKENLKIMKEKEIELSNLIENSKKKQISELIKDFYSLVIDSKALTNLLLLNNKFKNELKEMKLYKNEIQNYFNLNLSIDILFRNLFPFFKLESNFFSPKELRSLRQQIVNLLLNGFSFEMISGESLCFKLDFLTHFQNFLGIEKIYSVGVIGPQSSGKSTLLNYMFGTMFSSGQGRCTSGVYLGLQEIRNPKN